MKLGFITSQTKSKVYNFPMTELELRQKINILRKDKETLLNAATFYRERNKQLMCYEKFYSQIKDVKTLDMGYNGLRRYINKKVKELDGR